MKRLAIVLAAVIAGYLLLLAFIAIDERPWHAALPFTASSLATVGLGLCVWRGRHRASIWLLAVSSLLVAGGSGLLSTNLSRDTMSWPTVIFIGPLLAGLLALARLLPRSDGTGSSGPTHWRVPWRVLCAAVFACGMVLIYIPPDSHYDENGYLVVDGSGWSFRLASMLLVLGVWAVCCVLLAAHTQHPPKPQTPEAQPLDLPPWCKAVFRADMVVLVLFALTLVSVPTGAWYEMLEHLHADRSFTLVAILEATIRFALVLYGLTADTRMIQGRDGVRLGVVALALTIASVAVQLWSCSFTPMLDLAVFGLLLALPRVVFSTAYGLALWQVKSILSANAKCATSPRAT